MSLLCPRHPQAPVRARCVECGDLLCGDCRAKVAGRNYCRPCVPPALQKKLPGTRSPLFAAALSVLPGLGQMFAGRKARGLAFGGSALALAALQPAVPPTVLFFLWVYNLFDAHALAVERNASITGRALEFGEKRQRFLVSLFAIATAGTLVLRETIAPDLDVAVLWPAALGLFAVNAVADHLGKRRARPIAPSPSPSPEAANAA